MNQFIETIKKIYIKLFYGVKYINKENIPENGPFILVGNHRSNIDSMLIMAGIKRKINFLDNWQDGKDILKKGNAVGIFPEGEINASEYVVLPFKRDALKMALDNNVAIIPFSMGGEKGNKIIFGKAYKIKKPCDLKSENIKLMNKVIALLRKGEHE